MTTKTNTTRKIIDVEFLFLDESVCVPCGDTAQSLNEAMQIVTPALETMGAHIDFKKVHISTLEKAKAEKLLSSPTIRINGIDIDPAVTQDDCPTCSDIAKLNAPELSAVSDVAFDAPAVSGCCPMCDEATEKPTKNPTENPKQAPSILCRTWHWHDEVFQAAPVGKIVESIMQAAVPSKSSDGGCCAVPQKQPDYELPQNLKTFFSAQKSGEPLCCGTEN